MGEHLLCKQGVIGSSPFTSTSSLCAPEGSQMMRSYTANYTRIESGYMGQLVEWPQVVTEGRTLDECREMLEDALQEMIAAYRQQGKEIPAGGALLQPILVDA